LRPLEGVKDLRNRRMLSQQELADRAGVSLFTVQRIERGEGSVRPKTGRAIARALGVGVEDLLGKAQAPLPDFEDERPSSLQSWISLANRLADRWEKEIEDREEEWHSAAPAIRQNVKRVPNLHWANEIRSTAADILDAVNDELDLTFDVYTYTYGEAQEFFSAASRLDEVIGRTAAWYSSTAATEPEPAKVIDFREHLDRIQRRIGARAS
jgi:transcriptional regulator with XRE-family HTH domain